MSSAVLHAAPQNSTAAAAALNTPTGIPGSPSSRHHYQPSQHSSPSREGYHANLQQPSSNVATQRSSRRPSSHDHQNQHQPQEHSPPIASQSNSPMSSRAAIASPVAVAPAGAPEYYQPTSSDRRRHHAPIAPPRTSSSHQTSAPVNGAQTSRRPVSASHQPQNSSSRRAPDHHGSSADQQTDQSSSSRRRDRHHAPATGDYPPQRQGSTRDPRTATTTTMPIRTNTGGSATASSSKQPSREASEILNSMLVSQPEVDIEREKERLALAQPTSSAHDASEVASPPVVPTQRSRQDHSSNREKHTKFGEYILGNTIGEGEFGKVKLGWKSEGGVQVAIKLIKKDALGSNPNRMQKIMREVSILKQLTHPNIVRLHKMEESERHFGIILEYASGGELFDYILNNRYLKDNAARRLFAQLVSGVGYLHKKGIVHRDLKLENLLLDRNRNIIITDFGFANTFDPALELTEEEEAGLSNREFVKRLGLDKIGANGSRKGDLMQTSCGSPCYAAPELVVSDSLYTGRKVDVWSCGVILYAMLAGYLPFDDDPANPEGDNINLLYKYIVSTPLTFPEYVTPHAKDLLRRILVPDPRRRADLFEVARHSWLSEYAHVVEFITSSTTTHTEIQNTTVPAEDSENPNLARSASVREASRRTPVSPTIGGLASKQGGIDQETEYAARQQKDNKRRTVQVEYVAPTTQTQRGEPAQQQATSGKTRARSGSEGPVEVDPRLSSDKPLPRDPPVSKESYSKPSVRGDPRKPPSSHRNQPSISRPPQSGRVPSDSYVTTMAPGSRPGTSGSMNTAGARPVAGASRSSYGQPLPPTVAGTNVHGRIQQPTDQQSEFGRPSAGGVPSKFAHVPGVAGHDQPDSREGSAKGHRRSNTLGEITGKMFGRSGSIFGNKNRKSSKVDQPQTPTEAKNRDSRKYPPVSMSAAPNPNGEYEPRKSVDSKRSRRSFSFGLGPRKKSGSIHNGSQTSVDKQNKRFSFIPGSISLKAIGIGKETPPGSTQGGGNDSQVDLGYQQEHLREPYRPDSQQQHQRQQSHYVDQRVNEQDLEAAGMDGMYAQLHSPSAPTFSTQQPHQQQQQQHYPAHYTSGQYGDRQMATAVPGYMQSGAHLQTSESESSVNMLSPEQQQFQAHGLRSVSVDHHQKLMEAQGGLGPADRTGSSVGADGRQARVLQKNKRFVDAYDTDHSGGADHAGSSGAARRVMDFFRRRGKARGGDDR
ncbi:hypothetical protein MCOR29_010858 [Pyricularia oryzae]|nr:hypothetical protein MCOR19_011037 [Pyricularia oryzae]KAI6301525.1 hypothetical protein MCOR29_010858 [Pyricularia oryzae]KAI6312797.1 hypothetical protein MCOR30_010474 [Pyricularia oryzae]KAI6395487.1 hypothetical protein MCOR23_007071 [Pyricularia oryzae]KAI6408186.1 hypothetical protein MCOR20_005513 [Pyricularia oryzae]